MLCISQDVSENPRDMYMVPTAIAFQCTSLVTSLPCSNPYHAQHATQYCGPLCCKISPQKPGLPEETGSPWTREISWPEIAPGHPHAPACAARPAHSPAAAVPGTQPCPPTTAAACGMSDFPGCHCNDHGHVWKCDREEVKPGNCGPAWPSAALLALFKRLRCPSLSPAAAGMAKPRIMPLPCEAARSDLSPVSVVAQLPQAPRCYLISRAAPHQEGTQQVNNMNRPGAAAELAAQRNLEPGAG